ncbi:MAG: hypothetical protein GT598_15415 [Bacteroidales bacterium]|nr:hypothetical protein [Bacteroidales bacterium]HPM17991.1 hypothetical protein [Bacteroidales bacterium]
MDLKTTFDIIIKDLNDIREIIDDLKQYQGVPAIEIELAKSKCRSVSEIISFLRNSDLSHVGRKQDISEKREESRSHQKDPVLSAKKPVEIQVEKPAFHEPVKVDAPQDKPISPVVVTERPEPVPVPKAAEYTIIADQFANRPESFHEKLGGMKPEDDVLEIIKTKPVSSISEAIGINDKYLFIKEIFNGDQETYNRVLSELESAGSFDDAKSIIMDRAGINKENEAFRMFISILKRKFPSNE